MNFVGKRNRECDVEDPDLTDFKVYCKACGATKTPQWREGPLGPKTLCNACGVKWLRQKKPREAGPHARVHGLRRVHGTAGSSEDASHPGSSEGWSDPWTLCADDEDVATAADLLLLAGIASGATQPGHNVAAVLTGSAGSNEHDSATTIHLPIVKAETRPPTTGGQLLQRRVVARRPAVLQPPPAVMHRILAPMPIPVVLYEPQLAAVSVQAEDSGLVVAGCDNNKCNSADSHSGYTPAPVVAPTAAVAAPAPTVPPHELAELAMLQAAVISAFAELQAADAARIATLECLAQTQMAADMARAQAVELVQRLHQELRNVSAPPTRLPTAASGEVQPAAAIHIMQRPPQTQAQLLGH